MTVIRPRRSVAAVALASVCLFVVPGVAFGHAELDTMTPADKATVPPPTEVAATFTEALDPSGSKLVVVDAGGKVVAEGGTVLGDGEPKTMRLLLPELAPGAYTVRWTSKSADDGDLDRGETTFTVVAASASPSITPEPSAAASPSAEPSVSAQPSLGPTPSPSGGSGTATSTSDTLIPIVAVLAVVAALGVWLLRGRGRRAA